MAKRRQSVAKKNLREPKHEPVEVGNEPVINGEEQSSGEMQTTEDRCLDSLENSEPPKKIIKQEGEDSSDHLDAPQPSSSSQDDIFAPASKRRRSRRSLNKKNLKQMKKEPEEAENEPERNNGFEGSSFGQFRITINSEELDRAHFKPSFKDFTLPNYTYINCLIEQPEVITRGIFKITAPTAWSPTSSTQDYIDRLADEKVNPIIQIVTEHKSGVFSRMIEQAPATSFKEFHNDAMKNELSFGEEPIKVEDVTKNIFENLTERKPKYVIDHEGSLFDDDTLGINLKTGVTEVFNGQTELPGITTPMLYYGMSATVFCAHKEDLDLHSINYLHCGAPKVWFSIREGQVDHFEIVMQEAFPRNFEGCKDFIRHKTFMLSPEYLKANGVEVDCIVQDPGDFVVTNPRGYHWGYNTGFNIAEAVNFGSRKWLYHGLRATKCNCWEKTNDVDMEWEKIYKMLKFPLDQQMAAWVFDQMKNKPFPLDIEGVRRAIELTDKTVREVSTPEEEEQLKELLAMAGTPARKKQFNRNLNAALHKLRSSRIAKQKL